MTQPTYILQEFRFQQNSGSDSAPVWEAASGVDISLEVGVANKMLLRKQTYNNNNKAGTEIWHYEYSLNGGTWTPITATSVVIRAVAGILAFTDGYDCSNQLTTRSGVFVTDNNGYTTTGLGTSYTHTAAYYSETALVFYIPDTVDVANDDDIEIRIVEASDAIDYNSITANITVIKSSGDQDIDVPDTGTGADATPGITASIPVADTGSGTDTITSPTASVPLPDTGSGADAIVAPTASVPLPDTGSGTDAIAAPAVSVPLPDTGSGADEVSVDKGLTTKVATTRVACNTAIGTQTITTTDLGGLTPKAALLIATYATSGGVAADHAMVSIGAAIGTTERWVAATSDEHNLATTNSFRRMATDEVVMVLDPADGTVEGEADFSAWVTNGITINWGVALGSAYLLTVIFFAGDDVSAHADSVLSMGGPTIDITAPGFEPDVVFFVSTRGAVNDTPGVNFGYTFGVCANDGSDTQFSHNVSGADASGTVQNAEQPNNNAIYHNIYTTSKFSVYSCGGFDANGFTLTAENSTGGELLYLALNFGGLDFWLGDITSPTSAGDDAYTGPGFTPQAIIGGFSYTSLGWVGWNAGGNDQGAIFSNGIGIATENAEYSNVVTSEDLADTSNTQSLADDVFVNVQPHEGGTTQDLIATGPAGSGSFDANGFTLNYSAVDIAVAHAFWALAIEEATAETIKNVADVGSGAEAIANLAVTLSVSETGAGVMTLAPAANVPTADAGSGADIIDDILASIPVSDSGGGVDAINLAAKILAISDTANASDIISNISVNFILPETGTGTEALVVVVSLSVSDTASGLDEIDVLAALLKEVGDAGSGTETVAITNSFTVGDTASGTDTPQITVVLSIADAGSAIDAINVITDILKEIEDTGSGIDSLSISTSLAVTDVGAGTDSLQSVTASVTVSDVGSAIDAVNVISAALKEVSDAGAGADAIADITASIIVTDAGAGAEAIPVSVGLAVADTASGIDAINIAIHLFKQVADIGQGTDNISTSAQVVVTDLAAATDLVSQILVQAVVQDVASAIESIQIDTGSDYIYVTLTLSGNQSAASAGSNKTEIGLGANKSTLSV